MTATHQPFELEKTEGGFRLVLRSAWSEQVADVARRNAVAELELNYAKGWQGKDVEFLRTLPWLRSLKIIDWHLADTSPVLSLTELRTLSLGTYARSKMNYALLSHLTEATLEWGPGAATIFDCSQLQVLFLNHYDAPNCRAIAALEKLVKLSLASPGLESLSGLPKTLSFLGVYSSKRLADLDDLPGAGRLTHLELNACRNLRTIDRVGDLSELTELHLCDDGQIASLKPLARLSKLRVLMFYGSTNIVDGDLSPLTSLPQLERVVFGDRRHYSHRLADLSHALKASPHLQAGD